MLKQREAKIFTIICFIIFVLAVSFAQLMNQNGIVVLLIGIAIFIVYISGILLINHINNRIYRLRLSTENMDSDIVERFLDDELGRLANHIDKMISMYGESKQLQIQEKEFLRDIISDISHQIKTPLASLSLFNEIMQEDLKDERFTDMLLQSKLQLERIQWLVLSMLQLARIEANSITFNMQEVSAGYIINNCLNILQAGIKKKDIKFRITGNDAVILADGEWLQEALINVIKNAVDYSPASSTISIKVKKTPIATTISVRDEGNGIPEKDRLNVFKRFYRADNNSTNSNNVGIGLSLSKSIVCGMGGKIWIDSRHISECNMGEQSYTSINIML